MCFLVDIIINTFIKFTHYKVLGLLIKSPASGHKQNFSQRSTEETFVGLTLFLNALLTVLVLAIIRGGVLNQMEACQI